MRVNGQDWTVHAVGGSPAQAVQHALLEVMPQPPDLVVSGINYGENLASGITISGTVGAALEAASMGIPALAVSLETEKAHHLSYSTEVDFSEAAQITLYFARLVVERGLPGVAQVLKIDIPSTATRQTPWQWTRVSQQRYYMPVAAQRSSWDVPGTVGYELALDWQREPEDTDVYTLLKKRQISVCPLQLDLTAFLTQAERDDFGWA
jgi:5'-nucleotidase